MEKPSHIKGIEFESPLKTVSRIMPKILQAEPNAIIVAAHSGTHKMPVNHRNAEAWSSSPKTWEAQRSPQAEFENFKKRLEKDMEDYKVFANKDIIISLLPVLDSFESALKHDTNNESLKVIHNQLISILENHGLKKLNSLGQTFNPAYHEVLMSSESKKPENEIIEVYQEGYLLKDKVIRHAKVRVSKGNKQ